MWIDRNDPTYYTVDRLAYVPNLAVLITVLLIVAASTMLRRTRPLWRWLAASLIFALTTAWWMLGTHPPQSVWLNVPVLGGATFSSVFVGSREPFQERPMMAFGVSAGAALGGLLIGVITAIELGLLVP